MNLTLKDLAFLAATTPGSSGPTPPPVSGYWLWLTAESSLFQDSAGTTPAVANNDRVGRWTDLSGNGHNALDVGVIQIGFDSRPKLTLNHINGYPALRFTEGTEKRKLESAAISPLSTGISVFVIAQPESSSSAFPILFNYGAASMELREQNQTNKIEFIHTTGGPLFPSTFTDGNNYLFSARFDDSSNVAEIYQNGTSGGTTSGLTTAMPSGVKYALGCRVAETVSLFFFGYIAEVIAYPTRLSDADMASVHAALIAKYGL